MITYLVLGAILLMSSFIGGSPLRDDSLQSEWTKSETDLYASNFLHLQQDIESGGTTGLDSLRQNLSNYLFSVNYSLLVDFYLFQKINGKIQVTKLPADAKEFVNVGFKKSQETKVLIHGFANNIENSFTQEIARSYASEFDFNIIAVDWGKIAYDILYSTARYHVEGVGKYVGQFLTNLYVVSLIRPGDVHLIGHSLGAHVSSYAGKTAQIEGWKISRITGLDPAGILFGDPNNRLSKKDADLVDVIHTCMKFLGLASNVGHVDFYPNGGTAIQPGCSFDLIGLCSHGRSFKYYVESIQHPKAFLAQYCENEYEVSGCVSETTAIMGAWPSYTKEGAYYLKTSKSAPFGLNDNLV